MHELAVWQAAILLVLSFYLLAKGASWLVDGAVGIAERLRVPKLLIGILLVGVATSAPELAVSLFSALTGKPEMALGNVVGSNVVNDGVALALVGLLAATPVVITRRALVPTAAFLVVMECAAFILVIANRTTTAAGDEQFLLTRWGGAILLVLFIAYLAYLVWERMKTPKGSLEEREETASTSGKWLPVLLGLFMFGLVLIIGSSYVLVESAVVIARALNVREAIIALSVIAVGTSIPEIATCVAATRKGQGSLALGNILGSDIMNISGIAGASAVAHPLAVDRDVIFFMFPSMLIVVGVTLGGLLWKRRMTKALGIALIAMYALYVGLMVSLFPPAVG